jgi:hypothetical protein
MDNDQALVVLSVPWSVQAALCTQKDRTCWLMKHRNTLNTDRAALRAFVKARFQRALKDKFCIKNKSRYAEWIDNLPSARFAKSFNHREFETQQEMYVHYSLIRLFDSEH